VGAFTVHGMRSAARSWMADTGVPFELAEACLAHTVGNAVVQAYQRSSMLERRRPIIAAWGKFLTGKAAGDASKVVPLRVRPPLRAGSVATAESGAGFAYAVVVGRGDLKGRVLSRHRSWEAAERATRPYGANVAICEIDERGAPILSK
jgi:hypothetical protein